MKEFGLEVPTVDAKIDIWPMSRSAFKSSVLDMFDEKHPDHVKAVHLCASADNMVLASLQALQSKLGGGEEDTKEVAATSSVQDASGEIAPSQGTALKRWIEDIEKEYEDQHSEPVSCGQKKMIIAAVNFHLAQGVEERAPEGANIYVLQDQRSSVRLVSDGRTCDLPFFGRAVDVASASALNRKDLVLPLGDANKKGPRLFLDGCFNHNPHKADLCPAWMIPRLPVPKQLPKEDGGAEQEQEAPPTKKQKTKEAKEATGYPEGS